MPYTRIYNFVTKMRNRHYMLIDLVILSFTTITAFYIRKDGKLDFEIVGFPLLQAALLFTVIKMCIFYSLGLYKRYWRTASVDEMGRLLIIAISTIVIQNLIYFVLKITPVLQFDNLPYSLALIDAVITMIFISIFRFSVRLLERVNQRVTIYKFTNTGSRVIVAGAGYAGVAIVQEMQRNINVNLVPVAFVDDDPQKRNIKIRGVYVAGAIPEIAEIAAAYEANKVIIAMPSAPGTVIRRIAEICSEADIETLTVPGIYEILNGKVSIEAVRKIEIEDLLRREPVKIDAQSVSDESKSKKILVTGAGGSIGSEICRQLLHYDASEIILLGHGENSIFEIEQELKFILKKLPAVRTKLTTVIADIKDKQRIFEIFAELNPDIVYHAAAHKHVPLMELNPKEAVTNNILGTRNLIEAAVHFNLENFVLISSDKAVNPTNIMGATKRAAEMILLDAARQYNRRFSAVRFGNVLGSRGSVLHTFRRQIRNGGPLTITHPEITRYFMTIPEAVQLVLQASVLGSGGEIFMLDMGEPIKLMDLAKDFIRLSGYREGVDINIKITGLRPGEKLFEEMFLKDERYEKTKHEKILIASNASQIINPALDYRVTSLLDNINQLQSSDIYDYLKEIVPKFNPVYNNTKENGKPHIIEYLRVGEGL